MLNRFYLIFRSIFYMHGKTFKKGDTDFSLMDKIINE